MRVSPPRTVRASADSMLRIESSAFSALPSWMKPSSALRMTTPKMIAASSHRLEHQLGEAGAEQDVDQDVVELRQEPHERPPLLAFRQPVGPVLLQAGRGLAQSRPSVLVASRFTTSSAVMACQADTEPADLAVTNVSMGVSPSCPARFASWAESSTVRRRFRALPCIIRLGRAMAKRHDEAKMRIGVGHPVQVGFRAKAVYHADICRRLSWGRNGRSLIGACSAAAVS